MNQAPDHHPDHVRSGDRALPAGKKVLGDNGVTPGAFGAAFADGTPPESGLLGPVTILSRP